MLNRLFQIFIFFLILGFSSNCILFKESELDPKSDLSNLFGLYQLLEAARGVEVVVDFSVRENGLIPPTTYHRLRKVNKDYRLSSPLTEDLSSGEFVGTFFQNADGNLKLYLPGYGTYRLDTYFLNQVPNPPVFLLRSSKVLYAESRGTGIDTLVVDQSLETQYNLNLRAIQTIKNRGYDPYYLGDTGKPFEKIGSFDGKIFYQYFLYFANSVNISTQGYSVTLYPGISYSSDGTKWETLIFYEFPSAENLPSFTIGNFFQLGDSMYSFILKGTGPTISLLKIPLNNPPAYSLETFDLTVRSPGGSIDTSFIANVYAFANGIIYKENSASSTPDWRYDSNFLKPGSNNFSLTNGNSNNPFNTSYTGGTPIFGIQNGLFVNAFGPSSGFYMGSDLTTYQSINYIRTGGNLTLPVQRINPYITLFVDFNSPPTTIARISVNNVTPTISTTSLTFNDGITLPSTIDSATISTVQDNTRTAFSFNNGSEPITFHQINHSNSGFSAFNLPPKYISNNSEISEQAIDFGTKISLHNGRFYTLNNPRYSLSNYSNTTVYLTDAILSTSTDGINWSGWEVIDIRPHRRK